MVSADVTPYLAATHGGVIVHRLDQLFPLASGNKVFKLIGHFIAARRAGKQHLLSFGGAWSNHLHALSAFAPVYGFKSTAIVRGLHADIDNPMLADARTQGMSVQRVSKQDYAKRNDKGYLCDLAHQYPDAWIIPEGGDDRYGRFGMRYLAKLLNHAIPDGETLLVASGTGATVRGLATQLKPSTQLATALVVNDSALSKRLTQQSTASQPNFRLFQASGAGYGRVSQEQLSLLESLYLKSGVLLDPLYNGKALSVACDLAEQGEHVHLLHTGGVQGWRGYAHRRLLDEHPALKHAADSLEFQTP